MARTMSKKADEAFSPLGLSSSYAVLLMTVNDSPGILPKELSQIMQLAPSTLTRFIEKMEHRGLLKRQQVGRTTEVYPTDAGLAIHDEVKQIWNDLENQYMNILGKDKGSELIQNLQDAIHKLND
ncbi:hypothetical protein GCM10025777_17100 [Membranihabitans marinus]